MNIYDSCDVINCMIFFGKALIHGLNRHYYSIAINYRKNELEEKMLLNLHKRKWTDGLTLERFDNHAKMNESTVQVSHSFLVFCSPLAYVCEISARNWL